MQKNKIRWFSLNRKVHYWGALACSLPVLIIICTGLLLILRKEIAWVQPPTQKGITNVPELSFQKIFDIAQTVEQAELKNWSDISRLDVRPSKGMVKVRCANNWEIQIDNKTAEILQIAYRRSGIIESIHEGSFFSSKVQYGIYLPSAIILLVLWITGIYLFIRPLLVKAKKKKKLIAK